MFVCGQRLGLESTNTDWQTFVKNDEARRKCNLRGSEGVKVGACIAAATLTVPRWPLVDEPGRKQWKVLAMLRKWRHDERQSNALAAA